MIRRILLSGFLLFAFSSVLFADSIILKNGGSASGKILRVTESLIEYDPDGDIPFDTVKREDAEKIIYSDGRTVQLSSSPAPAAPVEKKSTITAQATPEPVIAGFHQHDGFFFRGTLGAVSSIYTISSNTDKYEMNGASSLITLAAGFAPIDNFIIFGEILATSGDMSTIKYNGTKDTTSEQNIGISASGVGISYYIPDTQFYLSSAIYSCTMISDGDIFDGESDSGVGFSISAGHEWWISTNWGIGVSAIYFYGKMSGKNQYGQKLNIKTHSFGLACSATFN